MFVSVAHAMGASGAGSGPEAMLSGFMPIILMLGIFYFLIIRPQQKRSKEHKAMLVALRKGDTVMTSAGFIGRIVDIEDDILSIDLGGTVVQVGRSYVAGLSTAKVKAPRKDSPKKEVEKQSAEPRTDTTSEDE